MIVNTLLLLPILHQMDERHPVASFYKTRDIESLCNIHRNFDTHNPLYPYVIEVYNSDYFLIVFHWLNRSNIKFINVSKLISFGFINDFEALGLDLISFYADKVFLKNCFSVFIFCYSDVLLLYIYSF